MQGAGPIGCFRRFGGSIHTPSPLVAIAHNKWIIRNRYLGQGILFNFSY